MYEQVNTADDLSMIFINFDIMFFLPMKLEAVRFLVAMQTAQFLV